ncbi:GntR family transcriptional regulator [bacterium]|nr:GntR family transcriptional regulator [bacterium]
MFFEVDLQNSKPVYQQLIDQVKLACASGRLKPDDRLPSIREVAVALRVNRNTIARVYSELEREGLVYTRAGQGCFVSGRESDLRADVREEEIARRAEELVAQAKLYGFSEQDIRRVLDGQIRDIYKGRAKRPRKEAKS